MRGAKREFWHVDDLADTRLELKEHFKLEGHIDVATGRDPRTRVD
jgi:nucleoside-diphosphate-sugar epimerase